MKLLAASPLLGLTAAGRLLAEEALDVFDFHTVAKNKLPPAHYGYLATGTDGNETLSANRRGFEDLYLRPMRMVDTREVSLETTLLDESLKSPIVLAPVGSQGAFHPEAELATARAARSRGQLQILSNVTFADFDTSDMTWDFLDRIRDVTSMKIVVKGIVTREDAASAVEAGADAVYVSNHGGRAEASGWGAIESLPEVVAAVDGRVPVMIDSGFRRGTDIFKALALGADAVCIGRADDCRDRVAAYRASNVGR